MPSCFPKSLHRCFRKLHIDICRFERELICERTIEGLRRAKTQGKTLAVLLEVKIPKRRNQDTFYGMLKNGKK